MLRRTSSSVSKISIDEQENGLNFDSIALLTPSPNRSKYEGKFVKGREDRRPLSEKTNKFKINKSGENGNENKEFESGKKNKEFENGKKKDASDDNKEEEERGKKQNQEKEKEDRKSESNTSNTSNSSFNEIFHLNTTSTKIEDLTLALSETLKENEQLHDTVTLLKGEIERLNGELLEFKEYAELYLLGKELIENQMEEIESLKKLKTTK